MIFPAISRASSQADPLCSCGPIDPEKAEQADDLERKILAKQQNSSTQDLIREYTQALSELPKFPRLLRSRSDLLVRQGNLKAALADLNDLVAQCPEVVEVYFSRAQVEADLSMYDAALKDANTVIAKSTPDSSCLLQTFILKHDILEHLKKPQEAAAMAEVIVRHATLFSPDSKYLIQHHPWLKSVTPQPNQDGVKYFFEILDKLSKYKQVPSTPVLEQIFGTKVPKQNTQSDWPTRQRVLSVSARTPAASSIDFAINPYLCPITHDLVAKSGFAKASKSGTLDGPIRNDYSNTCISFSRDGKRPAVRVSIFYAEPLTESQLMAREQQKVQRIMDTFVALNSEKVLKQPDRVERLLHCKFQQLPDWSYRKMLGASIPDLNMKLEFSPDGRMFDDTRLRVTVEYMNIDWHTIQNRFPGGVLSKVAGYFVYEFARPYGSLDFFFNDLSLSPLKSVGPNTLMSVNFYSSKNGGTLCNDADKRTFEALLQEAQLLCKAKNFGRARLTLLRASDKLLETSTYSSDDWYDKYKRLRAALITLYTEWGRPNIVRYLQKATAAGLIDDCFGVICDSTPDFPSDELLDRVKWTWKRSTSGYSITSAYWFSNGKMKSKDEHEVWLPVGSALEHDFLSIYGELPSHESKRVSPPPVPLFDRAYLRDPNNGMPLVRFLPIR